MTQETNEEKYVLEGYNKYANLKKALNKTEEEITNHLLIQITTDITNQDLKKQEEYIYKNIGWMLAVKEEKTIIDELKKDVKEQTIDIEELENNIETKNPDYEIIVAGHKLKKQLEINNNKKIIYTPHLEDKILIINKINISESKIQITKEPTINVQKEIQITKIKEPNIQLLKLIDHRTYYPELKYKEYIAFPVLASKSKLTVKKIITYDKNITNYKIKSDNNQIIKPEELEETLTTNKEKDTFLAESIIKSIKPEKLYKILLKIQKTNKQQYHLLIPDDLDEEYSKVFGMSWPITER